ncbi:MAG TPA: hypothetical protein VN026_17470 [Bacteroidia bacterium]|jgi:hypothetical protein|nr:hypothetical protein [Bacteroidia bacterium]
MHFVLATEIGVTGARRTQIEQEIDRILKPYKFARRLNSFYVVHINSTTEWDIILSQLQNYSKSIPEGFYFIMSPIIQGGRYDGMLETGQWDFINEITK